MATGGSTARHARWIQYPRLSPRCGRRHPGASHPSAGGLLFVMQLQNPANILKL
jgi:hypothetical protein